MERRKTASKREGEGAGSKRRRTSAHNSKKEEKVKNTKEESSGGVNAARISKLEDDATGSGKGIVHPLLIPHILDKIFQHIICPKTEDEGRAESSALVVKNVKNLRLVCRQWKETATRFYLRNRAPTMSFTGDPSMKTPDKKAENFLDVMKSSKLIPFQRYTILSNFFVKENEQSMKDFMRICGPSAVDLDIHFSDVRTMGFTERSFPDLSLVSLKAIYFNYQGDHTPDEIPCLIEVLLSAAKTLKRFQFYSPYVKWPKAKAMVQRFGECISKRLPKTVKILRLDMPLNDLHFITLAESEVKLEVFSFDAKCGASSMAIHKFIEKQAPTLKDLEILDEHDDESLSSLVSLDLPRFDQLVNLELPLGTLQKSFPDTFPKLASLYIANWRTESTWVELLSSAKKGLSLKEIYLPYLFPQAPLVKKAAQCFPNISKLHIFSPQDFLDTLPEVFVYFANVEELYISFLYKEFNADSLFSGVSRQDCRRIRKALKAGNLDNVDLRDVQHQPSLLNLTKLKKLVLEDCYEDCIRMTDVAAHFVFLKMASLKELHTPQFQMSDKYLGLLREKLTLKLE